MFQTIRSRLYAIIFVTICLVAGLGAASMYAIRWYSQKLEQISASHLPFMATSKQLYALSNLLSFQILQLSNAKNPAQLDSQKELVIGILSELVTLNEKLDQLEGPTLAAGLIRQVRFLEDQTNELHRIVNDLYISRQVRETSMNLLDSRLAAALRELEVLKEPHGHEGEPHDEDSHDLEDLELLFSHLHENLNQITRLRDIQEIHTQKAAFERSLVNLNSLLQHFRSRPHEAHMEVFESYTKAYDIMTELPGQQISYLKNLQNTNWLRQEILQNVARLRQASETLSQSALERASAMESEKESLRIQAVLIVMLMTIGAVVVILLISTQIMGNLVLGRLEYLRDNLKGSTPGELIRIPLDGEDELAVISREIENTHRTVNELKETALDQDRAIRNAMDQADHALSELRTTQRSLIQSEKMASMAPLFAAVAHEISTPLGAAVGVATHLAQRVEKFGTRLKEDSLSDQEIQSFYDFVAEGAGLLDENIQRLIILADRLKQSSGQQHLDEQKRVHLQDFLEEMVQSKRGQFKERGIEVAVHCPDNMEIAIHAGAMNQILTTLLMNSVTHAFEEGQKGLITIMAGTDPTSNELILTYSDNGRGISEQEKDRVFDPYYQSQKGDDGSGLGMLLIYSIVTVRLSGTIDVQSLPGEGIKFEIKIPTNNHSRAT